MRTTVPGQTKPRRGNLEKQNEAIPLNGQNTTGRYFRTQPMTYGVSLKTGRTSGGHYWNIPPHCEKRIILDPETSERWLDVGICKACAKHKKGECEAYSVKTGYHAIINNLEIYKGLQA